MFSFAGKVAFITGGTSGIGRSAAVAFAKAGAKVVVTGRRDAEGEETARLIKENGGDGIFVKADVSKESDVTAALEKTVATYGGLDIAFNNAGVEQTITPLVEQTEADFELINNINVKGVWLSMKHQIPQMLKRGGGAIVNMSSIAGNIAIAGIPLYVASKHAVIGLTKSVALEYAKRNIRVNAVSPGAIETELFKRFAESNPEFVNRILAAYPMGRPGRPEEVAGAVLWLCSEDASFVTGQTVTMDGGFTVQ